MARIAVLGAYSNQMKTGWRSRLYAWWELKRFDCILAYDWLLRWSTKSLFKILVKLGQVDKGLIEELKKSEEELAHKIG